MEANREPCKYCDDTGRIGSTLEYNSVPCTDCDIWWNEVQRIKEGKDGEQG